MFNIKNFKKKNPEIKLEIPFKIDITNLQQYSSQNLKEYIYNYSHHTKLLTNNIKDLLKKLKKIEEEKDEIKELNNQVIEVNLDLNSKLEDNLVKLDFEKIFENSINKVFKKIGISDYRFVSGCKAIENLFLEFEKKILKIEDFVVEIKDNKEIILESETVDRILLEKYNDKIKEFISFVNVELENQKNDVMNGFKYLLQNNQNFIKSIQYLFYNITQEKSNLIENYKFEDLILITTKKFQDLVKTKSKLKNENLLKASEIKKFENKIKSLTKENNNFENEKISLKKQILEFQRKCEDISKKINISENEKTGHLEILKILQTENYKINTFLKTEKDKNLELTRNFQKAEEEIDVQKKKINEIDTKYLSQLRQSSLKLNQSLQDKNNLEEKIIDLNIMLQQENAKYENLYKKFQDYKKDHQKKNENLNILKKLTNSFENTNISKSPRNKSPFSTSVNSEKTKKNKLTKKERENLLENLQNKIEDLNLKILTNDIYLSTERKVFDQLNQEREKVLSLEKKKNSELKKKINFLLKKNQSAKKEMGRLNTLIDENSRIEEESIFLNTSQNHSFILNKLYNNSEPILQSIQLPSVEHSECLMKVYQKLKCIYKSFVIFISGRDMCKEFIAIEKEINDALELVSLYLNI